MRCRLLMLFRKARRSREALKEAKQTAVLCPGLAAKLLPALAPLSSAEATAVHSLSGPAAAVVAPPAPSVQGRMGDQAGIRCPEVVAVARILVFLATKREAKAPTDLAPEVEPEVEMQLLGQRARRGEEVVVVVVVRALVA